MSFERIGERFSVALYILVLPLLFLVGYLYLFALNGPFFLSRIDPDYVYLLNGMNCSILHFDRIGHLDHPGTPFQVFIGICIDLIYFISGKDSIVEDVLLRPEHYLKLISHVLAIVFFFIVLHAGKVGREIAGVPGVFLLQSGAFLSPLVFDLSMRMMPDRFGMILTYFLMIFLIHKGAQGKRNERWPVLISGFISGLLVATKVIFLPVLLIPLFYQRKRILCFVSALAGFFIGISPIVDRFNDFSKFIRKIIEHDGIYGSGANQLIDLDSFIHNVGLILQINPLLSLTLLLAIIALVRRPDSIGKVKGSKGFYMGFIIAVLFSIAIVAKHYKNYYLIPVVICLGPVLLILFTHYSRHKIYGRIILAIAVLFCILTTSRVWKNSFSVREKMEKRMALVSEFDSLRQDPHYLLVKPEWLWGPSKEYGLIFGLSYVRHRDRYSPEIDMLFPRVLTYEGIEKELLKMRVSKIPNHQLNDQIPILIFDQNGRPARDQLIYIAELFDRQQLDSSVLVTGDKIFFSRK